MYIWKSSQYGVADIKGLDACVWFSKHTNVSLFGQPL